MKHLKHWKYQCLMSAPFLPWVYIHWADWIYGTMLAVGWIPGRLDGMAAFTAVGLEGEQHEHALAICFGVTCGSALWFIALSIVTAQLRTKVTPIVLLVIQKISGIVIAGFGGVLILMAFKLMLI